MTRTEADRVEQVLVVPRTALIPDDGWRGVRTDAMDAIIATIAERGKFEPRPAMEIDPTFKQVIPYLVLRDGELWFLMRRTQAGGDARLHDLHSIGIGGHLNPGDRDVLGGLAREWQEEIQADFEPEYRLVGLLNDDDTDVGRVHLGVVFVADVGGRTVSIRETNKLSGSFVATEDVRRVIDRMETWSQLVFDALVTRGSPGS